MLDLMPRSTHTRTIRRMRMGIPSMRNPKEEWDGSVRHWLSSNQQQPHLTRIPSLDHGGNSDIYLRISLCNKHWFKYGLPINPIERRGKKILTIIMPFGAFKCLTLPMGVMSASDLFQSRMVHMFTGMNKRCPFPYIDDVLHFKGNVQRTHLYFRLDSNPNWRLWDAS